MPVEVIIGSLIAFLVVVFFVSIYTNSEEE